MREIMRTNDPVVLSLAQQILEEAGLYPMVADSNMSVMEGSIGAFPRRLLVPDAALEEARELLTQAELGPWMLEE